MTSRLRLTGAAATLGLVLAAAACRKSSDQEDASSRPAGGSVLAPQSDEELARVVARVDDTVITVQDLQGSINRQSPYIRARYASKEQKRVFLDNMIRFEVLAREAARRGLDRDPEVIQTMKSAMITKLLRAELASGIKPDDIAEAELRAFFQNNQDRFNKPEEVRVSAIIVNKQAQADDVARLAKGEQGQSNKGFHELVDKYSTDETTKPRGGDLRYFGRDSSEVPQPVVEAAFKLVRTGDVAGPIAAGGKFYIIKQTGRRPAVNRTFEQVKREIQNELYKEKRDGQQKQLVEKLRSNAKIQVFEDALKEIRVDTSSRAGDATGQSGVGARGSGHSTADGPAGRTR